MKWGLAGPQGWFAQGVVPNAEIGTLALREWQNVPRPRRALGVNASGEAARVRTEAQLTRWRVPMEWIVPGERGGGVVNRYDDPAALCPARWSSLVGARRRALASEPHPTPCVVVNAGTLITIDALDANGVFHGGIALPGLHMMLRTLAEASPMWRTGHGSLARVPGGERRRGDDRRPRRGDRRDRRDARPRAARRRAGPLLPRGRRGARARAAPRRAGGGRG